MTDQHAQSKHNPPWFAAAIVVPLVLALALATFAWPNARLEPRDLPLGIAGPAQATAPVAQQLNEQGGFELHRYASAQAARQAIEDREVYGAIAVDADGTTLLVSSAASPLVAGSLEHAFASGTSPMSAERTVDVVPADPDDPRGGVLSSLVLPLVLASVVLGAIVYRLGSSRLKQTGALLAAATFAGIVATAMVQSWLGALDGPWLVNAGVLALTMLAIAAFLAGAGRLFGISGVAIGALTMVLVGNPWSGISSAPELLPQPIGGIGQLLPPGAGGNLLRSTAFFDGAGSGSHLVVLAAYATVGLAALWAGGLWRRRHTADAALEPAL